jgi:hypothetical protein
MKRQLLLLILLCPLMMFSQEYSYRTLEFNYTEPQTKAFTYKNLRIYPIKAKPNFKEQTKSIGQYTNLKDALAKKKIRITEKEGGADVNSLYAQNTSTDTLFLMAGEVIQGGKQDRVIGEDVVIPPGNRKVQVPVFCVETWQMVCKKRWQSIQRLLLRKRAFGKKGGGGR